MCVNSFVTAENINDLLRDNSAEGEIDLLSIDIDGNDWYIWKAIEAIQPRLCVFETHGIIPSELSLSAPYDPDFNYLAQPMEYQDFRGASLLAWVRLCEEKGYRLIGTHRHGFNAFFLRDDVGRDLFPKVSVQDAHNNDWTKDSRNNRWPVVSDLPWVTVD